MSFLNFSKKPKQEEVSVILDIGSASVGASLVLFRKGQNPKIIYTSRIPITIPNEVNEEDFTTLMVGFVKKTLGQVTNEGMRHFNFRKLEKRDIQKVICVYASPWFASETKNIDIDQDNPIQITEEYAESLIRKEQREFTEKLGIDDGVTLIEKKIINTKLNGYSTSDPYNKKAHRVEMNLFLGIVPTKIISSVEGAIEDVLHPEEIIHHSFSLTAYRTITNLFPTDSNSVIFDITGEVTDVSIVENDIIINTGSVPIGRNSLVREIAKFKEVNNDIALSYLHLYSSGRVEEGLGKQIENNISSILNKWSGEVKKIIPNLEEKTIFITADQDISNIFKDEIKIANPHKLITLNGEHFNGIVDTEKNIQEDVFISTIALFLDNLFQDSN